MNVAKLFLFGEEAGFHIQRRIPAIQLGSTNLLNMDTH